MFQRRKKGKLIGLDDFEVLSLVGRGAFGKVWRVKEKATGKIFAMKVMQKEDIIEQEYVKHVNLEREIMADLSGYKFITSTNIFYFIYLQLILTFKYFKNYIIHFKQRVVYI